MTEVFIGGSRKISRLDSQLKRRIDRIIDKRIPVIVGDANGVDKAVQDYLYDKKYDFVQVFCSGHSCRNNSGGWPLRLIAVSHKKKDFSFFAAKDRAMADEASIGLMIWDKKSIGTIINVLRMIANRKKVVLYLAPDHVFLDLKSYEDLQALIARCPSRLREKIKIKIELDSATKEAEKSSVEGSLF